MTVKRKAVTVQDGKYSKVDQIKSGGKWVPRNAIASSVLPGGDAFASRTRGFRHIHHRYLDRRLQIFRFRITRDDGEVITETMLIGIYVRQSKKDNPTQYEIVARAHGYHPDTDPEDAAYWELKGDTWFYSRSILGEDWPIEFSYNTKTQIWTLPFLEWPNLKVRHGKVFWAAFSADDCAVSFQYQPKEQPSDDHARYIYKTDDFYGEDEKLRPKFYEVRAPYFKIISHFITPIPDFATDYCLTTWCWENIGQIILTIDSSIEYDIDFNAQGLPYTSFWGIWLDTCNFSPPDCAACQVDADALGERWCASDPYPTAIIASVKFTTSEGDTVEDVYTNYPNNKFEHVISPIPYKVETYPATLTVEYMGPSTYDIVRQCVDDDWITFNLAYRLYHLTCSIGYSPKLD